MNYDYAPFYASIVKPFFAPPAWVFGVAWGIIYPLIAIALLYMWYLVWKKQVPHSLLWLLFLNMVGNILYTPIQIGLGSNLLAALDLLFIVGTLGLLEWRLWHRSKILFFLLLPYLLWGGFATILQLSITYLNFG